MPRPTAKAIEAKNFMVAFLLEFGKAGFHPAAECAMKGAVKFLPQCDHKRGPA
jgi:hypothetical protein